MMGYGGTVMVDITRIDNQTVQSTRSAERTNASSRAKSSSASTSSSNVTTDSVEISAAAKEGQTVARLVSAAKAEPSVRADAVEKAKDTLAKGGFEGREVSRKTAEKILDMF